MPIAKKPRPTPTKRYIESSAVVAALLEDDAAVRASIRSRGQRVMSTPTLTETTRAVLRARLAGRITAQQERLALRTRQRLATAAT